MRYKGKVYRPPSEAYSLIVQVTYGCSHNRCAFCDMYDDKHFAMRPMDEIREDFELARRVYRRVERVFLADGDALMRRTGDLVEILGLVYGLFPECQRVTCYASPTSLQIKSEDELRLLRSKGLQMVYMGLESGCDAVLEKMQKGHTAAEIVAAGQKARRCGLALSVTAISGLGSVAHWREHAADTARAVSEMKPDYLGLLTLMVEPGTPLEAWVREGSFTLLSPLEVLKETELFLQHVDSEGTVFRANHASNYLTLKGTLNGDRNALLAQIAAALDGTLTIDKLEAMTCVCSVGLDMIAVPGDTTANTISAIIADEAAIGMVNSKTTAVRIIPVEGKTVGDMVEMGGLLGSAPVMPVHSASSADFIARGGRIPAPLQSLKN